MVGFDGIGFETLTSDGALPLPTPEDGSGIRSYEATIMLATRADLLALMALQSVVTVRPALGLFAGGTAIVEKGVGIRSLIYPDGGAEITTDAILLAIAPAGRIFAQTKYTATARWLITGAVV